MPGCGSQRDRSGEQVPLFPLPIITETDNRPDVPPAIFDHFTALEISTRKIDVIWLSAHGLDNEAIAQALGITLTTVNSHWRNIGAPRGLTRKQARGLGKGGGEDGEYSPELGMN